MNAKKKANETGYVAPIATTANVEEEVEYGEEINWHKIGNPKSYYPTRLEYFAGKALQGMVIGRSDKDLLKGFFIAEKAVKLAKELGEVIDSQED